MQRAHTLWAERLREVREGRGLSRNELAVLAGVTVTTVWRMERGNIEPRPTSRRKILAALGYVTEDEFFSIPWQHIALRTNGQQHQLQTNIEPIPDIRPPESNLLAIYQWGVAGDPLDHESAPDPVDRDYAPIGKERLVGKRGFAIRIKGTSMTNRDIRDDDVVWVNPDLPARYNRPVLARVWSDECDGAMMVKLFKPGEGADRLWSDGDDGTFPVPCQHFTIIAPVVWITRGFAPR